MLTEVLLCICSSNVDTVEIHGFAQITELLIANQDETGGAAADRQRRTKSSYEDAFRQAVIDKAEGSRIPLKGVESHSFYARAREAFAIVATGQRRAYGCVIIKKRCGIAVMKSFPKAHGVSATEFQKAEY
jgi:hypothetical protein